MAMHTPGPWEAGVSCIYGSTIVDTTFIIATVSELPQVAEGTMEANARLIAAAPDLLSACEAIAAFADETANCNVCALGVDEHDDGCPVPAVRAAIAKARGT